MTDTPVALVSGSRGGIGRHIVPTLRRDGFVVVGLDRSDVGEGTADLDLAGNITDADGCASAVDAVIDRFGRLDVLVHCAGVIMRQPFDEFVPAQARELIEVNVWGALNLTYAAKDRLKASPRAAVVFLSSIASELGIPGNAAYGMSKAALEALVRTLAIEWAEIPVRVNAVSPCVVPTPMNAAFRATEGYHERKISRIPMRRMVEPSEVAEAVAFLAGDKSTAITGQVLRVDGGSVIYL